LSALVLSAGTIDPVFDSGTTNYILAGSATSTTVTPTVNESNATVAVNAAALESDSESAEIPLAAGNTAIKYYSRQSRIFTWALSVTQ